MKKHRLNCDLCNSRGNFYRILFEKNNYTIVKCRNCSLIFVLEFPEKDLSDIYDKSYYQGNVYEDYEALEAEKKRYYLRQLMLFENFSHSKSGKLLEIGCATGFFLDCAKFLGYEIMGTEVSSYSINIAKSKNHKVFQKNIKC